MSMLTNLLFRGGADKGADVPALISKGALLIDARTPGEFTGGHIEGAINIPYNQIAQRIEENEIDRSRTIVVYCHMGQRSEVARQTLIQLGYTNVVNGGGLGHMRHVLEAAEN